MNIICRWWYAIWYGPETPMPKRDRYYVHLFDSADGPRWRLRGKNNETLASSEAYSDRHACRQSALDFAQYANLPVKMEQGNMRRAETVMRDITKYGGPDTIYVEKAMDRPPTPLP